ncbi:hypothetical protein J8273_8826 [Carpediemonas membranifera]|uniref:Membrane-associated protein n=1 Tax=Carpediemonas membranifera TaxID=201153 RepID=A0A8J6API6_9EUKA|nr:hypothetical protein J8273_8826 [Carpediemonas membranifera]|eukprot:KAG9389533.1 hypothetical protein J8273_8826 [Carpediemonas membranifera]
MSNGCRTLFLCVLLFASYSLAIQEYYTNSRLSSDYRGHVACTVPAGGQVALISIAEANPRITVDITASFTSFVDVYVLSEHAYHAYTSGGHSLHFLGDHADRFLPHVRQVHEMRTMKTFFRKERTVILIVAVAPSDVTADIRMSSPLSTALVLILSTILGTTMVVLVLHLAVVVLATLLSAASAPVRPGPKSKWVAVVRLLVPGASHRLYIKGWVGAVLSWLTCGLCGLGPLLALPTVLLQVHRHNTAHYTHDPKSVLVSEASFFGEINTTALSSDQNKPDSSSPQERTNTRATYAQPQRWMPVWVHGMSDGDSVGDSDSDGVDVAWTRVGG